VSKKKKECVVKGCYSDPYQSGLCQEHHEKNIVRKLRRDAALNALTTSAIDCRIPDDLRLREELFLIQKWWNRACTALRTNYGCDLMPLNEAEFALEWCISLSEEIIDAERAIRSGKAPDYSLEMTRKWVWDCFRNLEAGLKSNGMPRH
jgi:hypothetical protein